MNTRALLCAAVGIAIGSLTDAYAEQPPPPCHPNPNAAADRDTVANRGDVVKLPQPLKDRLIRLADRPHTYLPLQAFAEADKPSQLFQYYLLDTDGFEANVFTKLIPGVNESVQLTATGGDSIGPFCAVKLKKIRRRDRASRCQRLVVRIYQKRYDSNAALEP